MNVKTLIIFLGIVFQILIHHFLFAQENQRIPDQQEQKKNELLLKSKIEPLLKKSLSNQYQDVLIHTRYILQSTPISKNQKDIKKIKLPGFNSYITTKNIEKDISGFVDRIEKYSTLMILVKKNLLKSLENKIIQNIADNTELNFDTKDSISFYTIPEKMTPSEQQEQANETAKKRRTFKDFKTPVDHKKLALSSLHLLKARQAYFNNDLNEALAEVIEAMNIAPETAQGYQMLGSIYYRLNWKTLAYRNWKKALDLEPENQKLSAYLERVEGEL